MKTWFLDNDKIDHYSLLGRKISILYFHGSVHIINDTPKTYHRIYHNLSKVPIKTLGRKNYIFLKVFKFTFIYMYTYSELTDYLSRLDARNRKYIFNHIMVL